MSDKPKKLFNLRKRPSSSQRVPSRAQDLPKTTKPSPI